MRTAGANRRTQIYATHVSQESLISDLSWLLLLAQLPAEPSSARVALWRRLRGAGAVSVINGVWALPVTEPHRDLFANAAAKVREQGGRAVTFSADALGEEDAAALMAQFKADRAREYEEFAEQAEGMLAEIDKETRKGKFTYAELEEIEQDFEKLTNWLSKIQRRDFFPDAHQADAVEQLECCASGLRGFSEQVFNAEGVSSGNEKL